MFINDSSEYIGTVHVQYWAMLWSYHINIGSRSSE